MKTPKPTSTPKPDKGCKGCPEAAPASIASDTAPAPAAAANPHQDCTCPKYEVRITAPAVKVGNLMCYNGAVLRLCDDKAQELVTAGVAVKLHLSF